MPLKANHTMTNDFESETHRRNIERYRYLLKHIKDTDARRTLERLLKEDEDRLDELDTTRRA